MKMVCGAWVCENAQCPLTDFIHVLILLPIKGIMHNLASRCPLFIINVIYHDKMSLSRYRIISKKVYPQNEAGDANKNSYVKYN